jgi:ADP-ribosylglycohydrolase
MVVGLIAIKRMTFETLEKALEMGGDTNIVAAMLGALLGATQGQSAIDNRRTKIIFRSDYIQQIGEEFGQALVQYLNHHNQRIKN